jgi:hypothetical protein
MPVFDPDDLSLLATLAENPSLSSSGRSGDLVTMEQVVLPE